ncbi:MAG: nitroreductase family deazaflavin-dependent oxidoreductase [Anaerolineales bacterium]
MPDLQDIKRFFARAEAKFTKYTPHRLHRLLYQRTGGRFGSRMPGKKLRVLLLTTIGRKSGQRRTVPVMYHRDDDQFVIVASNSAKDKHPAWYWNLKSHAGAEIQVGAVVMQVAAQEANEAERRRLWPELVRVQPLFTAYESLTDRQMPIIILRSIQQGETQ